MSLRNLFFLCWFMLAMTACTADGHVIRWETASEINTAGFNLYRGPTAAGPWERVNATLIPSSSTGVGGGRYVFRDTTADAGATYFYRLEEVELDGATRPYEVVMSAGVERRGEWVLWVTAAVVAIGIGWWLGGRLSSGRRRDR